MVWALPRSLAATGRIDLSFFSSGYLDVSVPRVPSSGTMCSSQRDGPSVRRVSPFGYLRFIACLRLPVAFRSLPRPSSALGAKASALCSSSLDFFSAGSHPFRDAALRLPSGIVHVAIHVPESSFILRPTDLDAFQHPGRWDLSPASPCLRMARNWPD